VRRIALVLLVALIGALATEAAAAKKPPADGPRMTLSPQSGLVAEGRNYVGQGQKVILEGRTRPYVPGQEAVVEVFTGRKLVVRRRVPITKAKATGGQFVARFVARKKGLYTIKATHRQSPTQEWFAARTSLHSISPSTSRGSRGAMVKLLQRGLRGHAYVAPLSGTYDDATTRGVIAFQKVNGMARTGRANGAVYGALLRRSGGFRLRYPKAGKHVEFDWSRQVLVLARNGRPERIYHTSSGKASTPTVFGTFRFYRKDLGTNSIGMVHSAYFIRGYAIHGYHSVPIYPASHGCLRVPIPSALSIYKWIDHGDTIFAYR